MHIGVWVGLDSALSSNFPKVCNLYLYWTFISSLDQTLPFGLIWFTTIVLVGVQYWVLLFIFRYCFSFPLAFSGKILRKCPERTYYCIFQKWMWLDFLDPFRLFFNLSTSFGILSEKICSSKRQRMKSTCDWPLSQADMLKEKSIPLFSTSLSG